MSQFHRHEPETADLLEAFEMLGQLAGMPSERPDGAEEQERLYDPRTDPDFQERRDELADDPLDSQRGNW